MMSLPLYKNLQQITIGDKYGGRTGRFYIIAYYVDIITYYVHNNLLSTHNNLLCLHNNLLCLHNNLLSR